MSDYTYDTYDTTSVKIAFENLRSKEKNAFYYGIITGGLALAWMVMTPNTSLRSQKLALCLRQRLLISLGVGTAVYGLNVTYPQYQFNVLAEKVNRKYSLIMTKTLEY